MVLQGTRGCGEHGGLHRGGGGCFCALASVCPTETVLQTSVSEPACGTQEVAKSDVLHLPNNAQIRLREIRDLLSSASQ